TISDTVQEDVGAHPVTVELSGLAERPVTVQIAVGAGSTATGSDYSASWGTFTIPGNTLSANFNVSVNDDNITEGDETLIMTLSSPTVAQLGTNTQYTLTIEDNEGPPTLQFAEADSEVDEDVVGGNHTVGVILSNPSALEITVDYAAGNGTAVNG